MPMLKRKVAYAEAQCLEIISASSLAEQIEIGNYQSLYDCGLYIFNTIERGYSGNDATETLWLAFMERSSIDNQVNSEMLLSLADSNYGLSKEHTDSFRKLVGSD